MSSTEESQKKCVLGPKRKKILRKFAETSSAHGFILIGTSRSTFKKVAWTIIVIGFWIICAYQIYISIDKYSQWLTSTSVRIRHLTTLQFPAVTICNLNPIRANWIRQQTGKSNEFTMSKQLLSRFKNLSNEEWKQLVMNSKSASNLNAESESIHHYIKWMFDKKMNLTEAGHDINDMLLKCSFQSVKCTAANFTRWEHGTYGNCYTMVVTGEHFSFIGPFYGLSLILNVQDDEYLVRGSQGAGFQIEIHPSEYIPFPEDKGFTISPGVKTSVGIKLLTISRVPWPYDGTECGDYEREPNMRRPTYTELLKTYGDERKVNYTHQACVNSCYQKRFILDCNCVDASFVTREDVETLFPGKNIEGCDVRSNNTKSADCFRRSMSNTARSGFCDQSCPQPCNEQDFVAEKAFALWPRESYYKSAHETWEKAAHSRITNLTFEEAKTNLLKLEVYFKELNYEAVTEFPAMDVWDLLSDIGGTLGLYVGVSFLTIGEVLELLLACIALPAKERLTQRAASKQLL